MPLYDKKTTYMVNGGIAFFHILIAILCTFTINKFLILSYNPSAYILLLLLISCVLIPDILAIPLQGFSRFWVRYKVNESGILCYGFGWKKWRIEWNKICTYGIVGYADNPKMVMIFISVDPSEKFDRHTVYLLTDKRVILQVNQRNWGALNQYMPDKMKNRLAKAIQNKEDCFYRIKTD